MSRHPRAKNKHPGRAARRRGKRIAGASAPRVNVISQVIKRGSPGPAADNPLVVPDAVRRRFIAVGNTYYLESGARAFVDRGDRLTTRRETTQIIQSLAEIARARGWAEVTLEGTKRFKRHMALAAHRAGLTVQGQGPHPRAPMQLARALVSRSMHGSPPSNLPQASDGKGSPASRTPSVSPRAPTPREWRGRLIDHGPAPYLHNRDNRPSYFITLKINTGSRTLWGADLRRALQASASGPVRGDEVVLHRVGQDEGTSRRAGRDAQAGTAMKPARSLQPHRSVIETRAFIEARADLARVVRDTSVSARDAVRRHPALLGTYLRLRAAQLAAPRLQDLQDQRQFVGLIRRALIASIARGEPLGHLRLRTRLGTRDERHARAPRADMLRD